MELFTTPGKPTLNSGSLSSREYERALDLLCSNPHLGAPWRNDRRRFPLRRFPYSIIYYTRGEELRVIAIAHHSRRPSFWVGRK